jgi:hypothetical protein
MFLVFFFLLDKINCFFIKKNIVYNDNIYDFQYVRFTLFPFYKTVLLLRILINVKNQLRTF